LVEAFAAGADDFLAKPFKPNVLLSRMLAGQRVVALNQEIRREQSNLQRFATEFSKINQRLQETQKKDAQNQELFALKQRQDAERARDFSLSASDWFWETDAKHCFCYFSDNFEKVYGLRIGNSTA
jgi:DNA-binding response OmpR family regulator